MSEIFFISYNESNAEDNWDRLKSRFPTAQRINGVEGIREAHYAAAKKSFTNMFWVVDGDAEIVDDFHFDYPVHNCNKDAVHIWHSINPINNLQYGYGAVKLLPKQKVLNMDYTKPDMTTSLSSKIEVIPVVSNITRFNTSPFSTWRSAFRESVKLSSKTIDQNYDFETDNRLISWCTEGRDAEFGEYCISGANAGKVYGEQHAGDNDALGLINNFSWLEAKFKELYVNI